jgi:sporulation protein YlmC with PRC-barrel domain
VRRTCRADHSLIVTPNPAAIVMPIPKEIPMSTLRSFGTAGALVFALALPAIAQTPPAQTSPAQMPPAQIPPAQTPMAQTPMSQPPATTPRSAQNMPTGTTAPAGRQHKTDGMWRASTLVGATVYNQSGDAIGTISDMLIRRKGEVSEVVISVGGFLGIDTKLVELPFDRLKFENNAMAKTNTAAGTSTNVSDYSVVLPDATKDSLTKMPVFTYHAKS